MIGLINWSNALIVTLLGFLLVFCLLVLLVFILMLFGVIMKAKKEPEKSAEKSQTSAVETAPIEEASEAEMAAIAMAIRLLYADGLDETETAGKLTFKGRPTAWNSKIYGINNLDR
ncbi:MAG: OadG family protein [Paludibacteraceae bacterium]|jgi:sodium pump decarboxylase gamma subunit|nr:OadG family protein [Paludibacteraceae bacterium]MBO7367492.1 OadG family protein [Paludibacteraceae bacterium]MBQ1752002.1 OadG family protein [Paludibacteraceae bacterium]MBQ1851744.1 OadG family protein [Paludibacteraceae bacterium]MBQ2064645.1 OadG family protein [Paludibacteraceae bacterium]